MEVVVTTGAIRRAKLQSNHHQQKPTPNFLQVFLSPNQQCQSTEEKAALMHTAVEVMYN